MARLRSFPVILLALVGTVPTPLVGAFSTSLLSLKAKASRKTSADPYPFALLEKGFQKRSSPTCLPVAAAPYTSEAISLFNNMKLPASIIAGAIVPLGLLSPLQVKSEPDDSPLEKRIRKMYQVLSVVTLATELIAVMAATVATNGLTERTIAPANSVWHLLQRDFELEWSMVNTHFVIGMLGFLAMIGSRAYFMAQKGLLGKSALGVAVSALALMVSIVNRGVAAGGGRDSSTGAALRYGSSIFALARRYTTLLMGRALSQKTFGSMEIISVVTLAISLMGGVRAVWNVEESTDGA
jgi:hypothetical protein